MNGGEKLATTTKQKQKSDATQQCAACLRHCNHSLQASLLEIGNVAVVERKCIFQADMVHTSERNITATEQGVGAQCRILVIPAADVIEAES